MKVSAYEIVMGSGSIDVPRGTRLVGAFQGFDQLKITLVGECSGSEGMERWEVEAVHLPAMIPENYRYVSGFLHDGIPTAVYVRKCP